MSLAANPWCARDNASRGEQTSICDGDDIAEVPPIADRARMHARPLLQRFDRASLIVVHLLGGDDALREECVEEASRSSNSRSTARDVDGLVAHSSAGTVSITAYISLT